MPSGLSPFGWSLQTEANRIDQYRTAKRLAATTFAFHQDPVRAAKATVSLRAVYPWMSPNLTTRLAAFGADPATPEVAEIAGTALARRSLRGWTDGGGRRNPREVRNVTADWRDVPLAGRVGLPQGEVDRAVSEMFGIDPAGMDPGRLAQYRQAFYTGRSLASIQGETPTGRVTPMTPEVAEVLPATATDLGIPTGATPREYLSNVIGPLSRQERLRILRSDPSTLARELPDIANEFTTNATTFAMARNIEQGQGDANLAFSLRDPNADPAAAEELASRLPGMDTTLRHIRRGGLMWRGLPLPGGEIAASELESLYTGPDGGALADQLSTKRRQLDRRYDNPDDMPTSVRAVYDGIGEVLDDIIAPSQQSLGPDLGNLNVSDLWNAPYDAARGTVRTATAAMDTLWQSGQARFRAIVDDPTNVTNYIGLDPVTSGAQLALHAGGHDVGPGASTWGETDFGIMLEQFAQGHGIDTGSGFFIDPDSQTARTRLSREQTHGLIGGHVITMGRFAADRGGLEPDTLPFDIASGTVDLAWQLVEPGGAAVDALAASRGTRRLLQTAGGFAETRTLHPQQWDEFIRGSQAQAVLQHYADLNDPTAIARSYETLSQAGGASRMPEWAHHLLADGAPGDTEYVEEMLRNLTGMGYESPGVALRGADANGLTALVAPGVAWRRRLARSRMAQEVPETGARALDIYDPQQFVGGLRDSLRNARVDEETIARIVSRAYTEGYQAPTRVRVQQLERELAGLPTSGPVLRNGTTMDAAVVRQDLTDTLDELRPGLFINTPTPRRGVLYGIWQDAQQAKRERLVEAGLSETQAAERVSTLEVGRALDASVAADEAREGAYWLRLVADGDPNKGAINRRLWGVVDGEDITDVSSPGFAHMAAEHLSRYLPLEDDYRELARLTRNLPQRWVNWLTTNPSGHLRSGAAVMDNVFMNRIWKPSRLLRPAWPLRVVGEEQFRIAASGLDSAVSHPLSYVAMVMGFRRDGRMHGLMESAGLGRQGAVATDALGTPWEAVAEHTAVLNRAQRTWILPTGGGSGGRFDPFKFYALPNGEFTTGYAEAWTDLLARAHSDDLMRRIAQIELGQDSQFRTIDELIEAGGLHAATADDIRLSPEQNIIAATRADLMDSHPILGRRGPRSYAARVGGSDEAVQNWDDYVESLQVRLFEITGRDPELMHTVARGRFTDGMRLDTPNTTRINRRAAHRLENGYGSVAPEAIGGDRAFHDGGLGRAATDGYDRALERLYALLGATPTDRLSRSPAFRQFYTRRMQELLPFMDEASQSRFLDNAEGLMRVPDREWHLRLSSYITDDVSAPTMASLRRASKGGTGDLSLEMADELARNAALDNTRWLLYDVHKRGQFMDAMRIVFPFGEAWKEVATRWLQLLARRPGTVLQRSTQVVGATGTPQPWEDVVDDPSQHGHIFTNATGETVFTYPGGEWLTARASGVPVELTGSLNGLTIMSSVLPGVGPVVQLPLAASRAFRDSPEFEGVRDALFPYGLGEDPIANWSGALADAVLSPAWQRVIQGAVQAGRGDWNASNDRLFLNSVMDVMRYRVSTGEYSTDSPQNINRLLRDSTRDAGLLYIVRGLAGLTMPSAPIPEFQVEGNDGSLLMLRALSDAYRQMQDEDYSTATQRFMDLYGDNLSLVLQSKTVARTTMLPVSEEGDRWVQEHPGIRDDYPLTFGLYAPQPTDPESFDFDAYSRYANDRSLQVLGRELDLRDLVYLANDRVASQLYRQREQELLDTPGSTTESGNLTTEAQRYLSTQVTPWLQDHYPGFGSDGLERGPSADDLRDALGRPGQSNTEVRRAVDDDRIPEPLRDALSTYLSRHDEILTTLAEHPDDFDGATTYYESAATRGFRDHMRLQVIPYVREGLPERYRSRWDVIVERLLDRTMLAPWLEEEADTELEVAA